MGLDYDKSQLKIAGHLAQDKGVKNARFKYHDLEKKLPFKAGWVDKVLCLDLLEHIVNREQLLTEIWRVLKPKGLAFIAIPNIDTSWKKLQKKAGIKNIYADPDHKIEYKEEEVREIFAKHNFKILDIKPVVYDTPWVGVFDLLGGVRLGLYAKIGLWKKKKVIDNLQESTGFRIIIKKA